MGPPLRRLSFESVKPRSRIRQSKAHVQGQLPRGNHWPRSVVDLTSGFILIEALVEKRLRNYPTVIALGR